jgi:hypothetical protein
VSAPGRNRAPSSAAVTLLCLGWVSLVTVAGAVVMWDWSYDDPYITYRYARNLANGLGFVYNAGQHVLSTTSPFFALILTPVTRLNGDIPRAANLIGLIGVAAGAIGLWDMARAHRHHTAGWVMLALYPTFPLLLNTLGSEMPLYVGLCILAISRYARQHYSVCAVLAGVATLTRPDGVLLAIVLVAAWSIEHRSLAAWCKGLSLVIRPAVIYVVIVGAWVAFAWAYFGSTLPTTLCAKIAQGMLHGSELFLPGLGTILSGYLPRTNWIAVGCAVIGLVVGARQRSSLLLVTVWSTVFFIAYSLIGVSRYFWYYVSVVPGFVVIVSLGVEQAIHSLRWATMRLLHTYWLAQWTSLGSAGLLVLIILAGQGLHIALMAAQGDPRIPVYRAAGEWLNRNTAPDATVAALEVGALGYYGQRTMIDFAGLIQPEISSELVRAGGYEQVALWALSKYKPDYLVLTKNTFPTIRAQYLPAHCNSVLDEPQNQYESTEGLTIYRCHFAR